MDTNFLDQVNRTVKEEIASIALGKSIEEQRNIFLTRAKIMIHNIGRCGGGQVFTSDKVYYDEIDISTMDSVLRSADLDYFDRLCRDEEFSSNLSAQYLKMIQVEDLPVSEVQAFEGMLSENVGYADASLALLALNLSQHQEVIIVTDDLKLQKTIKDLIKKRGVSLEGRSLRTEGIHFLSSLHFLRSLHFCCEMPNDRWRSAVWSFFKHQTKRYEDGMLPDEIYRTHLSYAGQCLGQVGIECEEKSKRQERKKYYELFEINDER